MEVVKPIPPPTAKIGTRSFIYTSDSNIGKTTKYPGLPSNNNNNEAFVGSSETTDRFQKPKVPSYSPSFSVAQPDYTVVGRPLARLVSKSSFSEYTTRYTVPNASKIERYPWLRPFN